MSTYKSKLKTRDVCQSRPRNEFLRSLSGEGLNSYPFFSQSQRDSQCTISSIHKTNSQRSELSSPKQSSLEFREPPAALSTFSSRSKDPDVSSNKETRWGSFCNYVFNKNSKPLETASESGIGSSKKSEFNGDFSFKLSAEERTMLMKIASNGTQQSERMDTFFKDMGSQFDSLRALKDNFQEFKVTFEKSIEVKKNSQDNQMELFTLLKDTKKNNVVITKLLKDISVTMKLQKDNSTIMKLQKDMVVAITKLQKDVTSLMKLQKDIFALSKLHKDIPAIIKLLKDKEHETTKPMKQDDKMLKEISIEMKKVIDEMKMLKQDISKRGSDFGLVKEELEKFTRQCQLLREPKQVPQQVAIRYEVPKPKVKRCPSKMLSKNPTNENCAQLLESTKNRIFHDNVREADVDLSMSDISVYEQSFFETTFRKVKPYERAQTKCKNIFNSIAFLIDF